MEINSKIIFVSDDNLKNELIEHYSLRHENIGGKTIYSGVNKFDNGNHIVLIYFTKDYISENIAYVKENFLYEKMVFAGNATIIRNQDIEEGDIIMPNTFIDENSSPIFVDYAIGENIDLKNFGLILNGICISGNIPNSSDDDIFVADVLNNEAYNFLKNLDKEDIEKVALIFRCINSDSSYLEYTDLVTILDLVL